MFDFTGTRFDFPVAEGVPDRIVLDFEMSETAKKVDLSGSTWQFRATGKSTGKRVDGLSVEHGEDTGELALSVPILAGGEYIYELFATDAAGDVNRVFYGTMTAITSEHAAELVQASKKQVTRRMKVVVPVVNGAKLELRWVSCSVAEAAAIKAEEAVGGAAAEADRARDEADRAERAADRAEGEADRAEHAADDVADEINTLIGRADEAIGKVEACEGRLDAIDQHIYESIRPDSKTGTWWIAGHDTGWKVTGEDGKSPYLNDDNFWMVWDSELNEYVNSGINARGEDGRCPTIGSNGNWLHWNQTLQVWEDSGVQAMGKNGINGDTVRRIIVEGVEDIPQEGETCNGGFYYYVPLKVAKPVAVIDVLDAGAGGFTVNGTAVSYPEYANREVAAGAVATMLGMVLSDVPGLEVTAEGSCVTLTADILGWTFEVLDETRYAVEEHVRMVPQDRYDVYAWLEQPDGTSGWVCVGEASDIATSEIYGLVKTATDVVVRDGAPVGNNGQGQLSVPMAETANPGSVKISFADILDDGGRIGFDAEKRMRGEPATFQQYGDVKLSYSGDGMTNGQNEGTIGRRSDGTIGVRWATLGAPGVVKLGSTFGQLNRIPYQQGVGATEDHKIVNNILFGGALQHRQFKNWINLEQDMVRMPWLETLREETISDDDRQYQVNDDYYIGIYTSIQFAQSEKLGLELLPATTGMLAGVYIASSMDDARNTAVPLARTVKDWSLETHYTKEVTYTKTEVDGKLALKVDKTDWDNYKSSIGTEISEFKTSVNSAISNHNSSVSQTLSSYDNYIHNQLFTKDEFNKAKEVFIVKSDDWEGDVVIGEQAYNNLTYVNPKIKYFLIADEEEV